MSAANPLTEPERDIPLPDLPATIRKMHENWALAYSRAEQLERELTQTRQAVDDWQSIALSNGEALAKAKVELERERLDAIQRIDTVHAMWAAEVSSDIARIVAAEQALADEREAHKQTRYAMATYRDSLHEIIDARSKPTLSTTVYDVLAELRDDDEFYQTCETCGGDGEVRDEYMVGSPGSRDGFRTAHETVDCDGCDGTGRAPR